MRTFNVYEASFANKSSASLADTIFLFISPTLPPVSIFLIWATSFAEEEDEKEQGEKEEDEKEGDEKEEDKKEGDEEEEEEEEAWLLLLLRRAARSWEMRNCMASRAALVRAAFLLGKGVKSEPKGEEGRAGMVQVQAKPESTRVCSL